MERLFRSSFSSLYYGWVILIVISISPITGSAETRSQYWDASKVCSDKIRKVVSHKVVPISSLNMDEASLTPYEQDQKRIGNYYYKLKLALRKPEGKIETVWFHAELNEAIEFLRLMRQGKIASILVTSTYSQVDDVLGWMFPSEKGEDSLRGLEACNEEPIIKRMAFCQECRILEWRGVAP